MEELLLPRGRTLHRLEPRELLDAQIGGKCHGDVYRCNLHPIACIIFSEDYETNWNLNPKSRGRELEKAAVFLFGIDCQTNS